MRKIVNLTILAVISAAIFSSCSVQKATTTKTMDITNIGVIQKPVIVDLDVQQTKITGTASDKTKKGIETIKNEAVKDALSASKADVLVEPNFTVTTKNSTSTVEVTGYPAKYKDFRNIEEKDVTWLNATNDIYQARIFDPAQKSDLTKEEPKKNKTVWAIMGTLLGTGLAILIAALATS